MNEMNQTFLKFEFEFKNNNLQAIQNHELGYRYWLVKSLSRNSILEQFFETFSNIIPLKKSDYLKAAFESQIANQDIIDFINEYYKNERSERMRNEDYLLDQLSRMKIFDWGGSYQNALEKHIVDNYVKRIQSYEQLNNEIDNSILESVRGYTLNSWYNHWTSIIIEDIFKDHKNVIPSIGLKKNIDFIINEIPLDLKVTYFPEEFLKSELISEGFGNELTYLKRACKKLSISVPKDIKDRRLKVHLYEKLSEDIDPDAKKIIKELDLAKLEIINKYKKQPEKLKVWLYENQGEKRFDASNRFFLILIDEKNFYDSWKLKRNIKAIKKCVNSHLDKISPKDDFETVFYWKGTGKTYKCHSEILFLTN